MKKTINVMCCYDGTMELVSTNGFKPLSDVFVFEVTSERFVVCDYDGEMLEFSEHSSREDAEKAAESLAEKSLGVLLITPEEIKKISKKEGAA